MRAAMLLKEMMLEGVIGIVEGLNPTLIRLKLELLRSPHAAKAKPKARRNRQGGGRCQAGSRRR